MIIKIIGNLRNLEDVDFCFYLEQYFNKKNEHREIFGIVKYFSEPTSKTCRHLVIFDNKEECDKCKDDNQYFRKLLSNYTSELIYKLQQSLKTLGDLEVRVLLDSTNKWYSEKEHSKDIRGRLYRDEKMKTLFVYIAKDWTGSYVFSEPPILMKCGGMPDIWSGHKLNCFTLAEDIVIPKGQYLERNIWWSSN